VPVPGEGGHATLAPAPADDFEGELLRVVRRRHAHVCAERLLSGIGLAELHRAVQQVDGRTEDDVDTQTLVTGALAGVEGTGAASVLD
jgi:glucokinase